jgi:hypothetical protein
VVGQLSVRIATGKPGAALGAAPATAQAATGHGPSPADLDAVGNARTMPQATTDGTTLAAAGVPKPARRWMPVAALGVAAVAAGVIAVALWARSPSRTSVPAVAPIASASERSPVSSAVASVIAAAASPAASALLADVALTVQSQPEAVEVFLGNERLGVAPGPVRIKRGADKVKLTFKAAGYKSADIEVSPSADGVVSVTLLKAPGAGQGAKKKPGSGELENPF